MYIYQQMWQSIGYGILNHSENGIRLRRLDVDGYNTESTKKRFDYVLYIKSVQNTWDITRGKYVSILR